MGGGGRGRGGSATSEEGTNGSGDGRLAQPPDVGRRAPWAGRSAVFRPGGDSASAAGRGWGRARLEEASTWARAGEERRRRGEGGGMGGASAEAPESGKGRSGRVGAWKSTIERGCERGGEREREGGRRWSGTARGRVRTGKADERENEATRVEGEEKDARPSRRRRGQATVPRTVQRGARERGGRGREGERGEGGEEDAPGSACGREGRSEDRRKRGREKKRGTEGGRAEPQSVLGDGVPPEAVGQADRRRRGGGQQKDSET